MIFIMIHFMESVTVSLSLYHDNKLYLAIPNTCILLICFLLGYRVSPQVLTVLLKRYSRAHVHNGRVRTLIAFDDFVSLSVRLRAYTGKKIIPSAQIVRLILKFVELI